MYVNQTLFNKILLPSFLVVLFSFFLACAPQHKRQDPCNFSTNNYGERVSIGGNSPLDVYIHTSFPTEWVSTLKLAMDVYNNEIGRTVIRINGTTSGPAQARQDGMSVIYLLKEWPGKKDKQATTSVNYIGNKIIESDMIINGSDFTFYLDSAKTDKDIHLLTLLTHEVGHMLGLAHSEDQESMMFPDLASLQIKEGLTEADKKGLHCSY